MIKIGEFRGEKGFFKEVFSENYFGLFNFKITFDSGICDLDIVDSNVVYCEEDKMNIEVFVNSLDLEKQEFKVKTHRIDSLKKINENHIIDSGEVIISKKEYEQLKKDSDDLSKVSFSM